MNLSGGKPPKKGVFKKYLVGVLVFFGLVFILTEISRALLGIGFWFYISYVLPF